MHRRDFLSGLGAAGLLGFRPLQGQDAPATPAAPGRITLLHTNDTHSRIDPFGPGNGSLSGRGGIARRATLVRELRRQLGPVLLLDAGDTFQGTPYFNRFKGRLDYKLMSLAGYDAGTLGNHDFDNGVEALVEAMHEATFPFVNVNFTTKGAPALERLLRPYVIRDFPGLRVGITGVGVAFKGLVAPVNCKGLDWKDPDAALKPIVEHLRSQEKVDLVVVLSHLGYDMSGDAIDDLNLARLVPGIDAIIGGHTHTFLDEPTRVKQARGETLVFQVGFAGVNVGRMDFTTSRGEVRAASGGALPIA